MDNKYNIKISRTFPRFSELLTAAFIVLKLCNIIDWNWFLVVSPFFISIFIGIMIALVAALLLALKR